MTYINFHNQFTMNFLLCDAAFFVKLCNYMNKTPWVSIYHIITYLQLNIIIHTTYLATILKKA